MLVLSRKTGESLILQQEGREDIVITLVRCGFSSARIGVTASKRVCVKREELLDGPVQVQQKRTARPSDSSGVPPEPEAG